MYLFVHIGFFSCASLPSKLRAPTGNMLLSSRATAYRGKVHCPVVFSTMYHSVDDGKDKLLIIPQTMVSNLCGQPADDDDGGGGDVVSAFVHVVCSP